MSEMKTVPQLLDEIKGMVKTQDKALNDGIELGMHLRKENEEWIEEEVKELFENPSIFLAKKALYYLEHDSEDNREKYLRFLMDLT